MIVERFLAWVDSAPDGQKIKAASALARAFLHSDLDEESLDKAEAAMTLLLDDPCDDVRLALATEICSHEDAPRHVIAALAQDMPEISMLVLAHSPVFVDAELVEVINNGTMQQQVAIACRPHISPVVANAIAQAGEAEASYGLLRSQSALLPTETLHTISERHGDKPEIRRALLDRTDLAAQTHLVLIDQLGETMRDKLGEKSWMPEARIEAMVRENCDKAVINYALNVYEQDLPEIIEYLITRRRLNAAFLLRAICLGNISMFSRALSTLADVPNARVNSVLSEDRKSAFFALYKKAGLPVGAFDVFACAVGAWRNALQEDENIGADKLPKFVSRTVLDTYKPAGDPQVDELLVLLRKIAAETARDTARAQANQIALEQRQREQALLMAPEEKVEVVPTPEELYPVIELPEQIIAEFAVHFAEEIVEWEAGLEEELSEGDAPTIEVDETLLEIDISSLEIELDEPDEPQAPANDVSDDYDIPEREGISLLARIKRGRDSGVKKTKLSLLTKFRQDSDKSRAA
ncbi:MAG: DUF2336 domain-containing protein [Rhizobiaceae bacterium]